MLTNSREGRIIAKRAAGVLILKFANLCGTPDANFGIKGD
jgi:hypothetical protein